MLKRNAVFRTHLPILRTLISCHNPTHRGVQSVEATPHFHVTFLEVERLQNSQ